MSFSKSVSHKALLTAFCGALLMFSAVTSQGAVPPDLEIVIPDDPAAPIPEGSIVVEIPKRESDIPRKVEKDIPRKSPKDTSYRKRGDKIFKTPKDRVVRIPLPWDADCNRPVVVTLKLKGSQAGGRVIYDWCKKRGPIEIAPTPGTISDWWLSPDTDGQAEDEHHP